MEEKDRKIIENAQIASINALNTVKEIDNILNNYNKLLKKREVEDKLLIRYINLLKTREVREKPEVEANLNMFLVYLIIIFMGILIYYDNINSENTLNVKRIIFESYLCK
tara:strand:+ start:181 stop:510 length:330 start_codon:yes stop_codon:yes gene_type:complete